MDKEQRNSLNQQLQVRYMAGTVIRGIRSILTNKLRLLILVLLAGGYIIIWFNRTYLRDLILQDSFIRPSQSLFNLFFLGVMLLFTLVLLYCFGRPWKAASIERNLRRIHFVNSADEPPVLLKKEHTESDTIIMEFETYGIPLSDWHDKQSELESALNCYIVDCYEGHNRRRIILETVKASRSLPKRIEWQDEYISPKEFELSVGVGLRGIIRFDLTKIPHALIGGSTGSGKTILLKCLLYQCHKKGAKVYISDFKGGVDFPSSWKKAFVFITEEQALLSCLTDLTNELKERKHLLTLQDCENIQTYNQRTEKPLQRIIFACDEIAEVLDKTGLNKEQKSLALEIENRLSVLARQGRAFGIHLLLGTQRPDSNILTGQIRNNLDFRICGRADDVLSKIVLDNTLASEIPKNSQGKFMLSDGTAVQAYYFDQQIME